MNGHAGHDVHDVERKPEGDEGVYSTSPSNPAMRCLNKPSQREAVAHCRLQPVGDTSRMRRVLENGGDGGDASEARRKVTLSSFLSKP